MLYLKKIEKWIEKWHNYSVQPKDQQKLRMAGGVYLLSQYLDLSEPQLKKKYSF